MDKKTTPKTYAAWKSSIDATGRICRMERIWETMEQLEKENQKAYFAADFGNLTAMTSSEYKATRERLGMTQAALAVALGVSRKAINEREGGGTITKEAKLALQFLALTQGSRPTGNR